ncbi:ABC transporter ATP-binding protein [Paenibacillus sp. UNC499MF]|uniref:ABC transporter ATP-binding protein n=1 Tax=Paenibacillus sp. UNC499MF TaxID=1502751 RepID=UPI0008A04992|nr:ABC transporter ATP-binding protein [Paenibacillus sp. UNC499MF]SEG73101.1 ABC-2 type transport system ATP-binding protein [Paenibacillus sp. UNC499MF]
MNAVEFQHISKTYPNFNIQDLSFAVPKGYITGLIGPNGAGKSTLIKILLHLVIPEQGRVFIEGMEMPEREKEIKGMIGFVSDQSHFYEHLTVRQTGRLLASFYPKWDEAQFQTYLEQFELPSGKKISDLSKGMKMKFGLAAALSHGAKLLVMDEPTAGLDPVFRRELLDLLADLMQDEQHTILFSTHITTDLDRVADYIAFMNRGKLVFSESKDNVQERYAIVKGGTELLDADIRRQFVSIRETSVGFQGLVYNRPQAEKLFGGYAVIEPATLEDIMVYTVKGGNSHAGTA